MELSKALHNEVKKLVFTLLYSISYPARKVPALLREMADELDKTIKENSDCECDNCVLHRKAEAAQNN
jgi:hypothetical protein